MIPVPEFYRVFSPLYSSRKRFLNICHVRCREPGRLLLFLVFLFLVFVFFFNFRLVFPFLTFSYLILTLTKQKGRHHQLLSDGTVRALDQSFCSGAQEALPCTELAGIRLLRPTARPPWERRRGTRSLEYSFMVVPVLETGQLGGRCVWGATLSTEPLGRFFLGHKDHCEQACPRKQPVHLAK